MQKHTWPSPGPPKQHHESHAPLQPAVNLAKNAPSPAPRHQHPKLHAPSTLPSIANPQKCARTSTTPNSTPKQHSQSTRVVTCMPSSTPPSILQKMRPRRPQHLKQRPKEDPEKANCMPLAPRRQSRESLPLLSQKLESNSFQLSGQETNHWFSSETNPRRSSGRASLALPPLHRDPGRRRRGVARRRGGPGGPGGAQVTPRHGQRRQHRVEARAQQDLTRETDVSWRH